MTFGPADITSPRGAPTARLTLDRPVGLWRGGMNDVHIAALLETPSMQYVSWRRRRSRATFEFRP